MGEDWRLVLAITALERIERAALRSGDNTQVIIEIAADALAELRPPRPRLRVVGDRDGA